jgi:hypothetical protein
MPLNSREARKILVSKFAFAEAPGRSDDHRWYELKLDGLPPIATKFSHSMKDIDDTLAGKIARQLRVPRRFLYEMISCKNDKESYYKTVRENPIPPWNHGF